MAKIYYKGRDYSRAIGGSGGGGGSVDSTDVPTAGKVSEFDDSAHINSEDMSSQDVSDFVDGLEAQGANLADFVVDEGVETVSGIAWKYRKWNNGTSECWGRLQVGANTSQGSVGGFYWNLFGPYGLPTNLFVEVPQGFFNLHYWDTGVFWGNVRTITATTVQAVAFRNNNASATAEGSFYLIGRWK